MEKRRGEQKRKTSKCNAEERKKGKDEGTDKSRGLAKMKKDDSDEEAKGEKSKDHETKR